MPFGGISQSGTAAPLPTNAAQETGGNLATLAADFVAHAPLSDAMTNPDTTQVGADLMVYNAGAGKWTRLQLYPGLLDGQQFPNAIQTVPLVARNATLLDTPRTPFIFKTINSVVVTTETTVWTPAAGKKFRLMGFYLMGNANNINVLVRDNTAGTTILVIPLASGGTYIPSYCPGLGNGILSAAANNVLTMTGSAAVTISGFVFGTEE